MLDPAVTCLQSRNINKSISLTLKCRFLLQEKFMPAPAFHLLEWRQLSQKDREHLATLHEDNNVYGYFLPKEPTPLLTPKVAYKEVAMLFRHLEHSSNLPHYLASSEANNDLVAELILDGIIQIEWEGKFVCGSGSLAALFGEGIFENNTRPGILSTLSVQAIQFAWMLNETTRSLISTQLYKFNTTPWDHLEKDSFYAKHSVREYLFNSVGKTQAQLLESNWSFAEGAEKRGWLAWTRPRKTAGKTHSPETYKLYISPIIDDLPPVFARSIRIITDSDALSFKIGSSLNGILRPDKMVVYFDSYDSLLTASNILKKEIGSFQAQGVPFSAQLDEIGMLSHGVDPPMIDFPEKIETGSWRVIVCNELAISILICKHEQLTWSQSFAFSKARLLNAGIDMDSWRSTKNT